MNIISPDNLKNQSLCMEIADTHLSPWREGDRFERYKKTPRPFSGMLFVLSDMEVVYAEAGGPQICARKGDILYIPPGVRYTADFRLKGAGPRNTYTVNFALFDRRGQEVQLGAHIFLLPNKVNPFMAEDLQTLHKRFHNPVTCHRLQMSALFFSILYYACRSRGEGRASAAVKQAAETIEREYDQNEKMEKYAQMCHMSLTYFYREFRAYTGMSPTQYRNSLRISMAKSYLHNTDMTVKEIALAVGIADEFYFSRLFKRITGITPKLFRKG